MACTTLLVGKNASYDGSTMIARNDDSGSGHFTAKKFVGGVDLERVDSYFLSAVQEAVGMVVALVILGRTGKMYLLRRRGSGFFNGLLEIGRASCRERV